MTKVCDTFHLLMTCIAGRVYFDNSLRTCPADGHLVDLHRCVSFGVQIKSDVDFSSRDIHGRGVIRPFSVGGEIRECLTSNEIINFHPSV